VIDLEDALSENLRQNDIGAELVSICNYKTQRITETSLEADVYDNPILTRNPDRLGRAAIHFPQDFP
jgi:hypothetical protein